MVIMVVRAEKTLQEKSSPLGEIYQIDVIVSVSYFSGDDDFTVRFAVWVRVQPCTTLCSVSIFLITKYSVSSKSVWFDN